MTSLIQRIPAGLSSTVTCLTVTVAATACKSSHGQESYLRVLNGICISKEYSILEKQKKNLIPKSIVS